MQFLRRHLPAIFILFITGGLLLFFAYKNEYSEGGADNVWHYYFSRYAPAYPEFFLHHWGKPFFILLSTSFAQFGFYGLQIFNVLVGLSAAIVTYKFGEKLKLKFNWLSIVLLLFTPLYFAIVQSGMTEPLMSLVLVASMYLLYEKKFLVGTILMSFSIYTRTEGSFLTLYVLFYLLLIGKWKYIPFLGVGFIFYSIIGKFSGHDFLWFFTENPYKVVSPYGHGNWMDMLKKYNIIWGIPQLVLLILSLFVLMFNILSSIKTFNRKKLTPDYNVLFLVLIPAVLFLLFHVIAWKFGMFASLGLERVLASVSPLWVVLCCYGIHKLLPEKLPVKFSLPVIAVFVFFIVRSTFDVYKYPLIATSDAKVERDAAKWFKANYSQDCIIYYAHPGIVFHTDRNPFDKEKNIEQFGLKVENLEVKSIPTYIFWDNQFSDSSCGLKLDDLLNSPKVRLIHPLFEDWTFKLYVFELVK
ncbi:MAG: hypothetical protein ACO1G9_00390 [Bacteroidota bacterium]